MKMRILGKTGIKISEIGVGAWQLGGPLMLDGKADGHPELGRDYCIDLIRKCGELGINFIDTAEQYGNGESERRVGEALKGQRDKWIVSTKFGNQVSPNGERVRNASAERVPISLEGSLRRLQTDYLDVYVYHISPDRNEAEEVARFLDSAKRKGQVRAVGISTMKFADIDYLHRLGCLDVVQFPQSMLDPQEQIAEFLARHQVGGVVRGAFAGGRLSGRYFQIPPKFSADDVRSTRTSVAGLAEYARCAAFQELVTSQRGMIQLALRYLLDLPTTHSIIPGGKSVEDYRAAIRATELPPLTAAEHDRIAQLRREILSVDAGQKPSR